MKNLGRRLLLLILLFNVISYIGFLVSGLLSFPAETLLTIYLWPWTLTHAFIGMVDAFVPVTITAVLLGLSFFFVPAGQKESSLNFSRIISSSVVLFLFLAALFTVLEEGFAPGQQVRLEEFKGNSSFAESSLKEGDRLYRQHRLQDALLYYDYYLSIDPTNEEVRKKREQATASLELDAVPEQNSGTSAQKTDGRLHDQSAGDLISAARKFLSKRDYYSAHYYATIASQIDPQRDDAKRIAAEAWNHINEAEFSQEATAEGELFKRKREAYSELNRGNTVRAYYLFHRLLNEHPMDADVQTFSKVALEKVQEDSFFIDELEHANPFPGRHNIFFVNTMEKGLRELVYFERFIPLGSIAYAYGVEIMGITPEGTVLYHLTAPAGKITETSGQDDRHPADTLMLRAIDRNRQGISYEPEIIQGDESPDLTTIRPLTPSIGEIPGFSRTEASLKLQQIYQLLALRPGYARHGYHPANIEIELVMRLMRPFSLLIFGYLSIALGWALRGRSGRRWYHYLLLPVVLLTVFQLSDLYLYACRLIYLYFILQAGFTITLIFVILIQAILLSFSLILVAGQSTRDSV